MGIRVHLSASGTRHPLAPGEWAAIVSEIGHGESSQKKTPYVQVVWKVTDEDAVDTEGGAFKGRVWDTYYLTEKSIWRLKKTASALGVDLGNEDADYDSLADFAEEIADAFRGEEAVLVTDLRDGDSRQFVEVTDVKPAG